jgi:hypothetical protein
MPELHDTAFNPFLMKKSIETVVESVPRAIAPKRLSVNGF